MCAAQDQEYLHASHATCVLQIDETMEGVRMEMALLKEIDHPGSALNKVRSLTV
jgi:hypothetical protein